MLVKKIIANILTRKNVASNFKTLKYIKKIDRVSSGSMVFRSFNFFDSSDTNGSDDFGSLRECCTLPSTANILWIFATFQDRPAEKPVWRSCRLAFGNNSTSKKRFRSPKSQPTRRSDALSRWNSSPGSSGSVDSVRPTTTVAVWSCDTDRIVSVFRSYQILRWPRGRIFRFAGACGSRCKFLQIDFRLKICEHVTSVCFFLDL